MKIALIGTNLEKLDSLLDPFAKEFSLVEHNPDYVFAFGGDGTLMRAEYNFPGIPKLFLRNWPINMKMKMCLEHFLLDNLLLLNK
jgi:hypothetical protein